MTSSLLSTIQNKTIDTNSFKKILIYCFTKDDDETKCKIGQTSFSFDPSLDKQQVEQEKKKAVEKRGKQIFGTSGSEWKLHWYFEAKKQNGDSFNDYDFREFLHNKENINFVSHNTTAREWMDCTPEQAKSGFKDFTNDTNLYRQNQKSDFYDFRDEQKEAINKTFKFYKNIKQYDSKSEFLWDCVMRFGKTISVYGLIQKCIENKIYCHKILILSHRPDVNSNWRNDFSKFKNEVRLSNFNYGSNNKKIGSSFDQIKNNNEFIYFCSIQKIRRNHKDELDNNEIIWEVDQSNQQIFNTQWDLIIIDEGHEGTTTKLAKDTFNKLKTKMFLFLSGTPFKLMSQNRFNEGNSFQYSYLEECKKREEYQQKELLNQITYNPYSDLPEIQIVWQQIEQDEIDLINNDLSLSEAGFSFKEFFAIDEQNNKFIHEDDINRFLDKLCNYDQKDKNQIMPFSNEKCFDNKHTLWWINNVNTAKYLEQLLNKHPIFNKYKIINAAGGTDDGEKKLKELNEAIDKINKNGKIDGKEYFGTITLTLRRLTTGVTVKEWTSVLILNETTSAQAYFQTAFRAKTPYKYNGFVKQIVNIYDFKPSRILEIIPQIIGNNIEKTNSEQTRLELGNFLNALPVITFNGNIPQRIGIDKIMQEIKTVFARKFVDSGFTSLDIINKDKLITNYDAIEKENFEKIYNSISSSSKVNETTKTLFKNDIPDPKKEIKSSSTQDVIFNFSTRWNNKTLTKISGLNTMDDLKHFLVSNKNIDIHQVTFGFVQSSNNKKFWIRANSDSKKYLGYAEVSIIDDKIKKFMAYIIEIIARVPLLMLALPIEKTKNFSLDEFCSEQYFDDESWIEFIHLGKTAAASRQAFKEVIQYIDQDVFMKSLRIWNNQVLNAFDESQTFDQAYYSITTLLKKVKNPDKETVLTPEKTTNIHYNNSLIKWDECENDDFTIIDINCKSGIYPLYALHRIYLYLREKYNNNPNKYETSAIIAKHIYVVCRTNAALMICRKILGLVDQKYNALVEEHIIQFDIFNEIKTELYNKQNS